MNLTTINNTQVEFKTDDNSVFTDSLAIAKVFDKRHADVLKTIKDTITDDDLNNGNLSYN